ncbi:putative N6-adenine methyltransferase-domain-containing protein, partial [Schizothecium vesticola]
SLSSSALDALQVFYAERDENARKYAALQQQFEPVANDAGELSMDIFAENWNDSQFWYSDETATFYAHQLLDAATDESVIAVVSTPSVFIALKNVLRSAPAGFPHPKLYLLEYDSRFSVFSEFVFYDYRKPLILPASLKQTITHLISDPPFFSPDCQTKMALTVSYLLRPSPQKHEDHEASRVIISTGERVEPLIRKLFHRAYGVRATDYEPEHERGLSNEYWCFANFEEGWGWR